MTDEQRAELRDILTKHAAFLGGGEQLANELAALMESCISPLTAELTRSAQLIEALLVDMGKLKNRADLAELKIEGVRQAAIAGKQRDPYFALVKILAVTGGQE